MNMQGYTYIYIYIMCIYIYVNLREPTYTGMYECIYNNKHNMVRFEDIWIYRHIGVCTDVLIYIYIHTYTRGDM